MKITAIIPARAGSKKIPKKNIKLFLGKPLIYYSIQQAQMSNYINEIIVTTDDEEIQQIAIDYGAEAPFLRPKEISGDLSTDLEFFQHYLQWMRENKSQEIPDILVQLRPTYPTRKVSVIDDCIKTMIENMDYDCVRTVAEYNYKTPYKMYTVSKNNELCPLFKEFQDIKEPYNCCRQLFPQIYTANGYLEVIKTKTIVDKNSVTGDKIYPFIMDESCIEDIDTENEWTALENKYQKSI
tara:strand:- start:99 stop:815 length:717 start_codon:yes stop_codon:yes gene_type:complete